ncbi:hypothetical protein K2173_017929 [Erythroxylum novogranatense]|uniref:EF-hand domain-containing protein n=1 Tax=Erythroxylum novogranatense TaxID=1862640 RepID=A0AAV8TWF4_9ROSI|nr:hypothetical protein K2173_017929 [Erythroxylum novogranatense]
MELIKIIKPMRLKLSPKRFLRSIKDRSSVSRSDPSSFSSSSSSSVTSVHKPITTAGAGTPTSVIPESSSDWSGIHGRDLYSETVEAFKLIDKDNDGFVSRDDLEALLLRLGAGTPSSEEVSTMLSEVDRDGDGCISVDTLMLRVGSGWEPGSLDEVKETFEVFDSDQDGRITAEELFRVFSALGDDRCTLEDCGRMIREVDKKGDGFVCFEDFCRLMELQR